MSAKPRDIRIKYNAQDLKFDANLVSRAEALRIAKWAALPSLDTQRLVERAVYDTDALLAELAKSEAP